ncbi:hypothetical protein PVAND_005756 [Polypedilum vanderplanki]|uniref:Protein kinase domain-containing protein n=1 Tax=Polypedilum vanderplanki TaxID=319348 RepID=A0A9J6C1Y6_POLVA|nr:hypothetical protein PVAND_005756 [Polypedilum vanderplanki]
MTNNDMTWHFPVLKPEDSGVYECIAENRIATEKKTSRCCDNNLLGFSSCTWHGLFSYKKVLHGDLAAKNLLCDDNIVKICDFGLARSMYKNDNYKKKGEAPLPFKWLSIEAISDHVFSTYSDVWAYAGVVFGNYLP